MKMAGREVFKAAVLSMSEACDEALDRAGVTGEPIDLLVPHQANVRIIEATAKHAGIPMDKVLVERRPLRQHLVGLDSAGARSGDREGRVRPASLLLLVAFGAGFTWGSAVVRW